MSLLSKILVFLNILAAGAFIALATMNWGKRQQWAYAVFRHELAVQGLPLSPPAQPPEDLDSESVAFPFRVNDSVTVDTIRKDTLGKIVPNGGQLLGGEAVANQDDEVRRVQKKLDGVLNNSQDQLRQATGFLLALARSGTERDGTRALLEAPGTVLPRKLVRMRRELAYLGRTAPQVAALEAMAPLADIRAGLEGKTDAFKADRISAARRAVAELARNEVPNLVPATGTKEDRDKATQRLDAAVNAVVDAVKADPIDANRVNQAKQDLIALGAGEPARKELTLLADLLGNPLGDAAAADQARDKLLDLALLRARTDGEREALTALSVLIPAPTPNPGTPPDPAVGPAALRAARALLKQHFEEALARPSETPPGPGQPVEPTAEKRLRIAHLLTQLSSEPAWQQRVVVVVGLSAYVRAVDDQATALAEMAQRLRSLMAEEQGIFMSDYQALVQKALFLAQYLDSVKLQLRDEVALRETHQKLLNARLAEKKDLEDELFAAQNFAKAELGKTAADDNRLFQIQQNLARSQDHLLELEEAIRKLEHQIQPPKTPVTRRPPR